MSQREIRPSSDLTPKQYKQLMDAAGNVGIIVSSPEDLPNEVHISVLGAVYRSPNGIKPQQGLQTQDTNIVISSEPSDKTESENKMTERLSQDARKVLDLLASSPKPVKKEVLLQHLDGDERKLFDGLNGIYKTRPRGIGFVDSGDFEGSWTLIEWDSTGNALGEFDETNTNFLPPVFGKKIHEAKSYITVPTRIDEEDTPFFNSSINYLKTK